MSLTRVQAIEDLREVASNRSSEGHRSANTELRLAYFSDAIDLRMVADLLEEGCDQAAFRWFWKLAKVPHRYFTNEVREFLRALDGKKDSFDDHV
jgi:hypothetical protein